MGKQLFSVQVLGWWQPYKCNSEHESHCFPQYSKASMASEFSLLAEYLLIPASFEQPTHYLYTWQRKLGQTFQSDSLLERERGNQLTKRGKCLLPLLVCGSEEPSRAPLYRAVAAALFSHPAPKSKAGRLLQITLLTLPRQTTLNKIQSVNTALICLPTAFPSFEAGT